jgi:hypothetical protein
MLNNLLCCLDADKQCFLLTLDARLFSNQTPIRWAGKYDPTFVFYPLDEPESQASVWVGIGDLAPLGDGIIPTLDNRDDQFGLAAAIKRLYKIDFGNVSMTVPVHGEAETPTSEKTLLVWKSPLQTEISVSTLEAEYSAHSQALHTLLPLKSMLVGAAERIGLPQEVQATILAEVFDDNQGYMHWLPTTD